MRYQSIIKSELCYILFYWFWVHTTCLTVIQWWWWTHLNFSIFSHVRITPALQIYFHENKVMNKLQIPAATLATKTLLHRVSKVSGEKLICGILLIILETSDLCSLQQSCCVQKSFPFLFPLQMSKVKLLLLYSSKTKVRLFEEPRNYMKIEIWLAPSFFCWAISHIMACSYSWIFWHKIDSNVALHLHNTAILRQ